MCKTGSFSLLILFLCSCGGNAPQKQPAKEVNVSVETAREKKSEIQPEKQWEKQETMPVLSPTAQKLDSMGLVNVAALDPTITVHMVYAIPDNFVGEIMYTDLTEAYLLPEAAEKLLAAHRLLREMRPEYRFIVYDAARPMSVQRKMWDTALKTGKQYYVANPNKGGGLHNFGAAVDLTIVDGQGVPLAMGTEYDHLGPEANTDREDELVSAGKLTETELANRLLLRDVMRRAGFRTVKSEWWHFNHCSRQEAIENYELIDF